MAGYAWTSLIEPEYRDKHRFSQQMPTILNFSL